MNEKMLYQSVASIKPEGFSVSDGSVLVRPVRAETDAQALFSLVSGAPFCGNGYQCGAYDPDLEVWRYLHHGPFGSIQELHAYIVYKDQLSDSRCFCVTDAKNEMPLGVLNLANHRPEHLKVELSGIWYGPAVKGKGVNRKACKLILAYLKEGGYRRVEWNCDARNMASMRAAQRLGFELEGVAKQHMIIKGKPRDTAMFALIL